jgi:ElaB/YqjD/DUF883 family membrane-anchored ribosome-binding protein
MFNSQVSKKDDTLKNNLSETLSLLENQKSNISKQANEIKDSFLVRLNLEANEALHITQKALNNLPKLVRSIEKEIDKRPYTLAFFAVVAGVGLINILSKSYKTSSNLN